MTLSAQREQACLEHTHTHTQVGILKRVNRICKKKRNLPVTSVIKAQTTGLYTVAVHSSLSLMIITTLISNCSYTSKYCRTLCGAVCVSLRTFYVSLSFLIYLVVLLLISYIDYVRLLRLVQCCIYDLDWVYDKRFNQSKEKLDDISSSHTVK